MKKLQAAIIGTGFMGKVHIEGVRRLGHVEIAAVADSSDEKARQFGKSVAIERTTGDFTTLLADQSIDAVHVLTPNAFHYPMCKAALEAGKHVLCEKPFTMTAAEARSLVDLARTTGLANCIQHNLRYYPVVQQIRRMIEAGELGEILIVQGTYSQDWLLYDTDWNWRVDTSAGGPSRCMADIGSHWFDMAEHVTRLHVTSLCADLQTFHPTRKQPKQSVETFANKLLGPEDYIETPVDTEDFGAAIFRMGTRTRGSMTASQVSAGRKNGLSIEIYGTKSSVAWRQERPDELWAGHREDGNQIFIKDPSLLKPAARGFADLPGGHSEGYDDTFKQVFRRFYASIASPGSAPEYPQFVDGLRQLTILNSAIQSNRTRGWFGVSA